jgi:hypothetical protein
MTKVVSNVDAINSSLSNDYWDNFKPTNNTSPEILLSSKNIQGGAGGGIQYHWRMGMHYNQTPDGWNGFAIVSEFYNNYNPNDRRIKNGDSQIISSFGNPVGMLIGQQYKPGGTVALNDRNGNPLVYTDKVTLITSGKTLETAGIRMQKYIPDASNIGQPDNDFVFMRYSDALMMKAEAIARGGAGTNDVAKLATLVSRSGQVGVFPTTLDGIYKERGKELWLEGWRRNDMIRFGHFLEQRELKPYVSDNRYALYPIPSDALFNANLKQNPGY